MTENIGLLRAPVRWVRGRHPFAIDAAVALSEHLHVIWTLPECDADYPLRRRLIKATFSRGVLKAEPISASRAGKNEREIWQRR